MVAGYHTPDSERNVLGREEEDRHSRTWLTFDIPKRDGHVRTYMYVRIWREYITD